MDKWHLILNLFLTVSLISRGLLNFLCLGSKIIQNYHFNFEGVKSYKVHPNLLNVHSKYGGSCSIYIMKASCVALDDKIEQLLQYFERTLSNYRDILNALRGTLGASLMSLVQQKNAPKNGNLPIRFDSP
jgi:hypothetical protein